jgi:hypothetical protein
VVVEEAVAWAVVEDDLTDRARLPLSSRHTERRRWPRMPKRALRPALLLDRPAGADEVGVEGKLSIWRAPTLPIVHAQSVIALDKRAGTSSFVERTS